MHKEQICADIEHPLLIRSAKSFHRCNSGMLKYTPLNTKTNCLCLKKITKN